ncbi:hypothetical protein IAT38_002712 [Cryptococcus sp. DSM 104549]
MPVEHSQPFNTARRTRRAAGAPPRETAPSATIQDTQAGQPVVRPTEGDLTLHPSPPPRSFQTHLADLEPQR